MRAAAEHNCPAVRGDLTVMDRADQLQGALPGEASQAQADSAHLPEAPKAVDHAAGEPTAEATGISAEHASAEILGAEAQDKQPQSVEAATEATLEPMPVVASAEPPEATPLQQTTFSAQASEAPVSEPVLAEPRSAEPGVPDSAAAQQPPFQPAAEQPPFQIEHSQAAEPSALGPAAVEEPVAVEPSSEQPRAEAVAGYTAAESQLVAEEAAPATPQPSQSPAEPPAEEKSKNMQWYVLKVQSNREETIRDALLKRVKIAGLEKYFGEIIIPTEKVTEVKGGKKRVVTRKLYPGYLVAQMEINDDTWYLVRDTSGIGDFTGAAGRPSPMPEHEVARILAKHEEKSQKQPKLKIAFKPGDQVKIHEGTFENFEGHVESIDETNGRVTVMINIFGRSTPVELEYWQIGAV